MVNTYFDKIITTDLPKSHNPVIMCIIHILSIVLQFLSIMLALYSILLLSYYAQHYAGIIGSSLIAALHWHFCKQILRENNIFRFLKGIKNKSNRIVSKLLK